MNKKEVVYIFCWTNFSFSSELHKQLLSHNKYRFFGIVFEKPRKLKDAERRIHRVDQDLSVLGTSKFGSHGLNYLAQHKLAPEKWRWAASFGSQPLRKSSGNMDKWKKQQKKREMGLVL